MRKEIRKIQKTYLKDKNWKTVNKNWKSDWKGFIKYDHDFDWEFLFELILYKLEKMKFYLVEEGQAEGEWTKRIESELAETIELGHYILDHDYDKELRQFFDENSRKCISLYLENVKKPIYKFFEDEISGLCEVHIRKYCLQNNIDLKKITIGYNIEWNDSESKKRYNEMVKESQKQQQKDLDKFFLMISRRIKGWWD